MEDRRGQRDRELPKERQPVPGNARGGVAIAEVSVCQRAAGGELPLCSLQAHPQDSRPQQ